MNVDVLTKTERDIAQRVIAGFRPKQIAAELRCTLGTVTRHLRHIRAKFGVGDVRELKSLLLPVPGRNTLNQLVAAARAYARARTPENTDALHRAAARFQ